MSRIRILPDNLINRIAAGEVVERPASIVKELLENSLDAGAQLVELELTGGGRDRIVIRDDGGGMTREELFLAIERHATSKLADDADLVTIETLGFRGEALPSIASVSRMRLASRCHDTDEGNEAFIDKGVLRDIRAKGMPVGTEIEITRLFKNVPARRKFLRTAETEKGHCLQRWTEQALANPGVHFRVRVDGRELYNLVPTTDLAVRAQAFFSGLKPDAWFRLHSTGKIKVGGLLAPPVFHQSNWNGLYVLVNGRCVQDKTVRYAVLEAYRNQLPARRYPRGVIVLTVPPAEVDVNVHPRKAQVRFRQPQQVKEAIRNAVMAVMASPTQSRYPEPLPVKKQTSTVRPTVPMTPSLIAEIPAVTRARRPEIEDQPRNEVLATSDYRLVGCLRHTYIIVETSENVVLIDQHAAHERLLFEKLQAGETVATQGLLLPYTLDLTRAEALLAKEWLPVFGSLGFIVEPFGGTDLIVTAVPAVLGKRAHDRRLLLQVLEDALRERSGTGKVVAIRDHLLKTIACKAAIKAGEPLQPLELKAICDFVFGPPPHWTCPHGRPLVWKFTWEELAHHFAR